MSFLLKTDVEQALARHKPGEVFFANERPKPTIVVHPDDPGLKKKLASLVDGTLVIVDRTAPCELRGGRHRVSPKPRSLDDAKVAEVRKLKAEGWSAERIARKMGVGHATIWRVVNRQGVYK
jgi:hypothetical protein